MSGRQHRAELADLAAAVAAYRAAVAEGSRVAREITAAGDLRDAAADLRDLEAARRERERDLAVLLDVEADYGVDWPERRAAALDRERAKQDRVAAHLDRRVLADQVRRLVQAGGGGDRHDGVASSAREPRTATNPRLRQLHFTGTVSVDGVPQPIRLDAASWEEAVARLGSRYGADPAYVLRIRSTGAASPWD